MAEENTNQTAILNTPSAWLGYTLAFYGLIALILGYALPDVLQGFLATEIFLGKVLGVFGLVFIFFSVIHYFNYFNFDRNQTVGLFLGLTSSVLFILIHMNLTIFQPLEEFSIDARFRLSSFELQAKDISKGAVITNINPKAHPAIEIIGIDNPTINEYQEWPFSWRYYADFLRAIEGSKVNTVMFDIFFQDEIKNQYGLRDLSRKFVRALENKQPAKLRSLANKAVNELVGGGRSTASQKLSVAMKNNGKSIVDYSFETARMNEETTDMEDYQERLKYLNRWRIGDIVPTPYNKEIPDWVDHPEPPIPSIGKVLKGIGYANIRKQDTGVNRTLPLVIKWRNSFYPSIDLIMAARYYGVDLTKDVQVKMGEYVKIRNIPDKKVKIGATDQERDLMAKPNDEREVTIPIDEEGFMAINFIGGAWNFTSHSFVDLASAPPGEFGGDNDPFGNKVLLVAMYYATGVAKDIHAGPFGEVAGIEHHASALNTILQQDFLYYAPDWVNYLILIAIGLALGFVVPRFNIQYALIFSVVIAIIFLIEVFVAFNAFNTIHMFFTPYILLVVTLILIIGYKVLTEEANVKYIRSTFSRFVSKDIVNELLANPEAMKLGGEKKELTVFFSDIRGFTTISEALSPEALVKLLNEYLSEMTEIVLLYKGTIDKYMGDAIMAFWGAPVPNEDHAYLGCLASLDQMNKLKKLQAKWTEEGVPPLEIGIGLNCGDAVAGNMGSSHRMEYTVMGDTINLGSRLEGSNKQYGTNIIISENVMAKVKDRVIARELDTVKVKGKTEPVTIYELLDVKDESDFESHKVTQL